ncbi:MAG TPA: ATP-binding SpoIIE family protein phosphatase [Candidatus Limnocylindria bacterium]|nr:ATP-binding SpoIIE family protein phosphatase [Candidatus Limnocylindria bacterium]
MALTRSDRPRQVAVLDASQAGEARRTAVDVARQLGLDEVTTGRIALVATELATNLARHARGGEMLLRSLTAADGRSGVELVAVDRAPGIADVGRALEDGRSTMNSAGTGLGAVRRLSTMFEIHSQQPLGTVVWCEVWPDGTPRAGSRFEVGAVCVPYPGELDAGDVWALRPTPRGARLLVCDGLGHGPDAHHVATEAYRLFDATEGSSPEETLWRIHEGLAPTRGGAVAVAEIDLATRALAWASVGNISGRVITADGERNLVAHNGTVGHSVRKVQEFRYPWPVDALLVVHTDGLASHWRLERYAGLALRHPGVIAATLYRDARRPRDDAAVVVLRDRRTA